MTNYRPQDGNAGHQLLFGRAWGLPDPQSGYVSMVGVLRASSFPYLSRIISPSSPVIPESPEKQFPPGMGNATWQSRQGVGFLSLIRMLRESEAQVLKLGVTLASLPPPSKM